MTDLVYVSSRDDELARYRALHWHGLGKVMSLADALKTYGVNLSDDAGARLTPPAVLAVEGSVLVKARKVWEAMTHADLEAWADDREEPSAA